MESLKTLLINLAGRVLVAMVVFVVAGIVFIKAGGPLAGFLLVLPLFIIAGLVLAPAISEILAKPLTSLFYSSQRHDRPQPLYSVQAAKRAKGFYEEAMLGYMDIARDFPDHTRPYIEMMEIAVVDMKDEERARAILARSQSALKNQEDRDAVKRMFDATITRLQSKPEWLEKHQEREIDAPDMKDHGPVDEPDGITSRRFHTGRKI